MGQVGNTRRIIKVVSPSIIHEGLIWTKEQTGRKKDDA
jgi:hypothetical protein